MNKRNIGILVVAVALAVIGVVSALTFSMRDDQVITPDVAATDSGVGDEHASSPELAMASPDEGAGEGISIHGHWKVTVSDPDGTVVEVREFENALTDTGAELLADILIGTADVGPWSIGLYGSGFGGRPCWNAGESSPTGCYITESSAFPQSTGIFDNLVVSKGAGNTIVLSGSATARMDAPSGSESAQVRGVFTLNGSCVGPDFTPNCGDVPAAITFTTKPLTTVIDVTSGQQINVTVTISFN